MSRMRDVQVDPDDSRYLLIRVRRWVAILVFVVLVAAAVWAYDRVAHVPSCQSDPTACHQTDLENG